MIIHFLPWSKLPLPQINIVRLLSIQSVDVCLDTQRATWAEISLTKERYIMGIVNKSSIMADKEPSVISLFTIQIVERNSFQCGVKLLV